MSSLESIIQRAVSPSRVRVVGNYTSPPTYGVYEVPRSGTSVKRYRIGNYPVRMRELEREFGSCRLGYLFESREDAAQVARLLESDR